MQTHKVQLCESDQSSGTIRATGRTPRRCHTKQQCCCFQSNATLRKRVLLGGRSLLLLQGEPGGGPSASWRRQKQQQQWCCRAKHEMAVNSESNRLEREELELGLLRRCDLDLDLEWPDQLAADLQGLLV